MTKQASIAYLSDLMDHPGRITDADMNSIGGFRQSFPYFVPARYLEAYHKNKTAAFSPALLSSMNSYMGDWMMFCDFLNSEGSYDARPATMPTQASEAAVETAANTESTGDMAENELAAELPQTKADLSASVVETIEALAEDAAVNAPGATAIPEEGSELVALVAEEVENGGAIAAEIPTDGAETIVAQVLPETVVVAPKPEAAIAVPEPLLPVAEVTDLPVDAHVVAGQLAEDQPADDVFASLLDVSVPEQNAQPDALPEQVNATESGNTEKVPLAGNRVEDLKPIDALEQEHDAFWTGGLPAVDVPDEMAKPVIPTSPTDTGSNNNEKPLIYPVYTEDYFLQQGEKIPADMPLEIDSLRPDEHRSLMVMMSFSEWLLHFKSTTERQKEEHKDQRALKTMWQKEKLAAAIEEENEEIPENVFEMAVNSITREDGLMSESLAEIYVKQGKLDKALEMYRKLSLRNPQKNAYFADKIKEILKENQS